MNEEVFKTYVKRVGRGNHKEFVLHLFMKMPTGSKFFLGRIGGSDYLRVTKEPVQAKEEPLSS